MINEDQIKPFLIVSGDRSTSVILSNVGTYNQHIFDERAHEGFTGNGYDWGSLARVFLEEKAAHLKTLIRLEPEGGMFCAYSTDRAATEEFAVGFHAMCENELEMRDLFSRAELD